ncbi:MAG: ABC transporter ATP-binding protein [Bacilli bacterium]|nr:ABC transporter ATP-binding protein [Bacilli bacterium]MBQ7240926.1 ABC transporter ATP-binding protein [Bacilli bacterium]
MLIIAVFFAFSAAILSTVAPNKLADVTDVITEGIKPNMEELEKVSTEIFANAINNYAPPKPQDFNELVKNDKEAKDFVDEGQNDFIMSLMKLPAKEKEKIFTDIEVDGVNISTKDQLEYLTLMSTITEDVETDDLLKKAEKLPDSIKSLIEPKMNTDELKRRSIILGIIYLLNSIFAYIEGIIMAYVGIGYARKLRSDISHKINKLPLRYFDSHEAGDVLSRVTNDVDTIGINISDAVTSLVTNITLFLGSIVMMFVTNWIMALTAIASSIIGFALSFMLLKISQKYFVQRQKELGNLNGHIEEIYSGHSVVKSYNGEVEALKEFNKINDRLYECNRKSQFLSGIMQPIMSFIGNFGYVMVCVVGAILVMNDYITFGVIVAFMIYVRLFTNPLSRIAQALTTMQSVGAAGERVFEFLEENELSDESNIKNKLDRNNVKGNIEFKNIKFGYSTDKTIIKNFTASVKSGDKIAIVGPTGAGKTTMVNLLMKFYEIDDGDILIDGVSIRDLTRSNIHELFDMVLQDTWLFDGTVRENLIFNNKGITDDDLWKVCKNVGVDHFIKTLPKGLGADVGDNNTVSSGQKQLLTIARGMIEDAPFLILDEATSNVDTRTEELVQKAMDKLTVGKTSFIIAHRLSTIKNADLILVMDEGNIVEQGKHEELLKKNGFYAKLYNSQFQK